MANHYRPEWERENSPTKNMGPTDMAKYYKTHRLEGDIAFYTQVCTRWPEPLTLRLRALVGCKQTLARTIELRDILHAWRHWSMSMERQRRATARLRLDRMQARHHVEATMAQDGMAA